MWYHTPIYHEGCLKRGQFFILPNHPQKVILRGVNRMEQRTEGIKRKGKPRVALPLVKTVKEEPEATTVETQTTPKAITPKAITPKAITPKAIIKKRDSCAIL